jgi:hypothetical protein
MTTITINIIPTTITKHWDHYDPELKQYVSKEIPGYCWEIRWNNGTIHKGYSKETEMDTLRSAAGFLLAP